MSKLITALISTLVAALFGLASIGAIAQAPKADENKDSTVRQEAREAKAKAKRTVKKTERKARKAKAKARDEMKKDEKK